MHSNYYGRKVTDRDPGDYVCLSHPVNKTSTMNIHGVPFFSGWGVAIKNSTEYFNLKRLPMFKKVKEFPLSFLRVAGFSSKQVKQLFGKDIADKYEKAIKPLIEQGISNEQQRQAEVQSQIDEQQRIGKLRQEKQKAILKSIYVEEPQKTVEENTEKSPLTDEQTIEAHKHLGKCIYKKADETFCQNNTKDGKHFCFGHARFDPNKPPSKKKKTRKKKAKKKEAQ